MKTRISSASSPLSRIEARCTMPLDRPRDLLHVGNPGEAAPLAVSGGTSACLDTKGQRARLVTSALTYYRPFEPSSEADDDTLAC